MAALPLLHEAAANPALARDPSEHARGCRDAGVGDVFFPSGQGISGMLPALRPIRVRTVRLAVRGGARLPYVFRAGTR